MTPAVALTSLTVSREGAGDAGRRVLAPPDQPGHQPRHHRRGAPRLSCPAQPPALPLAGVRGQPPLGRAELPPGLWGRDLDTDLPRLLSTGLQVSHSQGGGGGFNKMNIS